MSTFVTIAFLICHTGGTTHLACYEKGNKNLRSEEIVSRAPVIYTKCSQDAKICELTEWDGCKYTMLDKTVNYSGEPCQ